MEDVLPHLIEGLMIIRIHVHHLMLDTSLAALMAHEIRARYADVPQGE